MTSLTIWISSFVIYSFLIWYAGYFDPRLVSKLLTFDYCTVLFSVWDVVSDVNYITTTQIYSRSLFWGMVASILFASFVFPCILIFRKRIYPMLIDFDHKYFPGKLFLSPHIWFATHKGGIFAVKDQLVFKRKVRKDFERIEDDELRKTLERNIKNWKDIEDIEREEMIDRLCTLYDDIDWNPLNFYPAGHDSPEKVIVYILVTLVVFIFQIGNIVLYFCWYLIFPMRLVVLWIPIFFISGCKLIHTERMRDWVIFFWNPDIYFGHNHDQEIFLDQETLYATKVIESTVESFVQYVLQLQNTVLITRGNISDFSISYWLSAIPSLYMILRGCYYYA